MMAEGRRDGVLRRPQVGHLQVWGHSPASDLAACRAVATGRAAAADRGSPMQDGRSLQVPVVVAQRSAQLSVEEMRRAVSSAQRGHQRGEGHRGRQ